MLKVDLLPIDGLSQTLAFELVPSPISVIVLIRDDGKRLDDDDYWYQVARTLRQDLIRGLNTKRRLVLIEEVLLLPENESAWVNHFIAWRNGEPVLHLPLLMRETDPLRVGILKLRERQKSYEAMRVWLDKTLKEKVSPWAQ